MAIFKINKTKNYTSMSNYHFKDNNLSLKAKGLLSEMLSLPEDWDYSIAGLVAINKESETSIKSTLEELKEYGYLKVTKLLPNETDTGRYEYIYDIYEIPYEKQEGGFLGVEIQPLEILEVENVGQLNTNNKILNNKELINNIEEEIYKEEENIFDYYQSKVGNLSPSQFEELNNLLKQYSEERIKESINIAIDNNAKNFNYIKSVIKNGKIAKNKKEVTTPNWMNSSIEYERVSDEELADLEKEFEIFD